MHKIYACLHGVAFTTNSCVFSSIKFHTLNNCMYINVTDIFSYSSSSQIVDLVLLLSCAVLFVQMFISKELCTCIGLFALICYQHFKNMLFIWYSVPSKCRVSVEVNINITEILDIFFHPKLLA
jgi:hypothetical protein